LQWVCAQKYFSFTMNLKFSINFPIIYAEFWKVSLTRRTDTFLGIIYHRHFPISKRRWFLTIGWDFILQVMRKLWTTKQMFFLIRQVYELSGSQYLCTKVHLLKLASRTRRIYRVIPSVLDPGKYEYLKDYSLFNLIFCKYILYL
jgi:hypothetical protein